MLAVSACQLHCGSVPGSGHTGGYSRIVPQGQETWTINGRPYAVAATYYLPLPEGLQYTIDYQLPPSLDVPHDDTNALAIAFPLIAYAYESGLYRRSSISKAGTGSMAPTRIGVALYRMEGPARQGYATALTLDQVRHRLASGKQQNGDGQ